MFRLVGHAQLGKPVHIEGATLAFRQCQLPLSFPAQTHAQTDLDMDPFFKAHLHHPTSRGLRFARRNQTSLRLNPFLRLNISRDDRQQAQILHLHLHTRGTRAAMPRAHQRRAAPHPCRCRESPQTLSIRHPCFLERPRLHLHHRQLPPLRQTPTLSADLLRSGERIRFSAWPPGRPRATRCARSAKSCSTLRLRPRLPMRIKRSCWVMESSQIEYGGGRRRLEAEAARMTTRRSTQREGRRAGGRARMATTCRLSSGSASPPPMVPPL